MSTAEKLQQKKFTTSKTFIALLKSMKVFFNRLVTRGKTLTLYLFDLALARHT